MTPPCNPAHGHTPLTVPFPPTHANIHKVRGAENHNRTYARKRGGLRLAPDIACIVSQVHDRCAWGTETHLFTKSLSTCICGLAILAQGTSHSLVRSCILFRTWNRGTSALRTVANCSNLALVSGGALLWERKREAPTRSSSLWTLGLPMEYTATLGYARVND